MIIMNKKELSNLFIGTSGWSYKHWSGIFYPEGIKPAKYLEYYLTRFDCVELNASFYHLPRKATVEGWVRRTPDTFVFCPKMSRYITHLRRLTNTESSLKNFFSVFEPMNDRLGPVLIQLPPGLKYDAVLIKEFVDMLKKQYGQFQYAIEVRHKSWIGDGFFSLLEEYGMSFVIADSGNRYPYYEAITTNFVYMRFHGNEKLYASDYQEWELREYADKISSWMKKGKEVWAFFNNDYGGYAVKNAQKLRDLVALTNDIS